MFLLLQLIGEVVGLVMAPIIFYYLYYKVSAFFLRIDQRDIKDDCTTSSFLQRRCDAEQLACFQLLHHVMPALRVAPHAPGSGLMIDRTACFE